MNYAKQGNVKKTVIRYIYESDADLVRIENESSKGFSIIGYCNLSEVDDKWAFAAKNGETLVDMTTDEIQKSNQKAFSWTQINVPRWGR